MPILPAAINDPNQYARSDNTWAVVATNLANISGKGSVPQLVGSGTQPQVWLRGDNSWQALPLATTLINGVVPALPTLNQTNLFLRADDSWQALPLATTTVNGVVPALVTALNQPLVYLRGDDTWQPLASGGTSHSYDYDDFLGPAKFMTVATAGGAAGGIAAPPVSNVGFTHPGVYQLAPGTTANLGSYMYCWQTFLNEFNTYSFRAIVQAANAPAGSTTQHWVGFSSSVNTVILATGFYIGWFYAATTNANWLIYCRNAASVVTIDSGIPALGAWVDLTVVAGNNVVNWYSNGTLIYTLSGTNAAVPAGTSILYPSCWINASTNTANYTLYVDLVEVDVDTGYTNRFVKTAV